MAVVPPGAVRRTDLVPLYLIHVMPVLAFGHHAQTLGLSDQAFRVGLVALLGGLVIVAWGLHRWVERPAQRLAQRYRR